MVTCLTQPSAPTFTFSTFPRFFTQHDWLLFFIQPTWLLLLFFYNIFGVLQSILEAIRRLPSPAAHSSTRGGRVSKEIPLVASSELGNTFFGTEDQKLIEEQASLVYLKRWLD